MATSLVLPFDSKVARNYASLRCDRPSALQMPCSWLVLRQQAWICSSPTMRGCKNNKVEGIQFIVSLDRVPM